MESLGSGLPGAMVTAPEVALCDTRRRVKCIKKYVPKRDGDGRFFCMFVNSDGEELKAKVAQYLYHSFDVSDVLEFQDDVISSRSDWITVVRPFVVIEAVYPLEETEIEIMYMSVPKEIQGRYIYLSNLGTGVWASIPYPIAKDYFDPVQATNGDLQSQSYYQRLGMEQGALQDELRQAYRALARRFHPDLAPSDKVQEYTDKMAFFNEAWDILGDPSARQDYDAMLATSRAFLGDSPRRSRDLPRRWPGSGAGTLTCLVEKRPGAWLVKRVLRFRRNTREQQGEVPMTNVQFFGNGVRVTLPQEDGGGTMWVPAEDLPFTPSGVLQEIRDKLEGTLAYHKVDVQRARWARTSPPPVFTWESRTRELIWSDVLVESLEHYEAQFAYAGHLREAAERVRQQMAHAGIVFDINAIAEAANVTPEDLREVFWNQEYDAKYAEYLKQRSVDDRWGYCLNFLVFHLPDDVWVFERPVHGAATYIFKDPGGHWTPSGVATALGQMNLLTLRRDNALQEAMGYIGFVIHQTETGWVSKVNSLVEGR